MKGLANEEMKRLPKLAWVCLAIVLIITLIFQYQLNKAEEHVNTIKERYQEKNDFAFLTFLDHTPSFIPLAETLEAISVVDDKEDPANVQQLIEMAKELSDHWYEHILLLIEFSDDYSNDADPQVMINYSIMTSKKQEDMFLLAFKSNIWRVIYNVSARYWKVKPKLIDKKTRTTLTSIAKEVRLLETTIVSLREMSEIANNHEGYVEVVKRQLLDNLRPHLEKLKIIQDDFAGSK